MSQEDGPSDKTSTQDPADHWQRFLSYNEYPPLLELGSRTRARPYQIGRRHYTPSESIGSNYTPSARDLRICDLRHKCRARSTNQGNASTASSSRGIPLGGRDPASGFPQGQKPIPDNAVWVSLPEVYASKPLSPDEQLEILHKRQEQMFATETEPTERDLERYEHYINNSIPLDMMEPPPAKIINYIVSRMPKVSEDKQAAVDSMKDKLVEGITANYYQAVRRSIVDYILIDPAQRQRLQITNHPKHFPSKVICGPMPWHASCIDAKAWLNKHLFTVHPMMAHLKDTWDKSFSSMRFVKLEELYSANLPLLPGEFKELIQRQCQATRHQLTNNWRQQCVSQFDKFKDLWQKMIPRRADVVPVRANEFFACAGALMSNQLRCLVEASLLDLLQFFTRHQEGNDIGEPFHNVEHNLPPPVLLVKLSIDGTGVSFSPSLQECWEVIEGAFMDILKAAEMIQRVECELFPAIEDLYLSHVHSDEQLVIQVIGQAKDIFHKNIVGPTMYLTVYDKYSDLLNDRADQDVTEFLKEDHPIEGFTEKAEGFMTLWREVSSLRVRVPLSLFCLNAGNVNKSLREQVLQLKDRLAIFKLTENRVKNKSICDRYQEIKDAANGCPANTAELAALNSYLKETSEVTIVKLREELQEAIDRLVFLMLHATLDGYLSQCIFKDAVARDDDINMNAKVFDWPGKTSQLLNIRTNAMASQTIQASENLTKRISKSETTLTMLIQQFEAFKQSDTMNKEDIETKIDSLFKLAADCEATVEDINKEETLLGLAQSSFPLLQELLLAKQPFDQLWCTAKDFNIKHDIWMNGPLKQLNADSLSDELDGMWKTMNEQIISLANYPEPCVMAEMYRARMDKLKKNIPILCIICNPSIQDRHWEKMSSIVGVEVKPGPTTSLADMLDLGLANFTEKLEEVGAAASEEYSLVKAMDKMNMA